MNPDDELVAALRRERYGYTVPEFHNNAPKRPLPPVFSVETARERIDLDKGRGVNTPQWIRLLAEAPLELDEMAEDEEED